jgi:hypothetical protein
MPKGRIYPFQRVIRISLRTLHIGAAAMTMGAVFFGGDPGSWPMLLMATGLGILSDDLYKYGLDWMRWLNFWVLAFKLTLLGVALYRPDFLKVAMWSALILGSLISHAPGKIRHAALWGKSGPCALPSNPTA